MNQRLHCYRMLVDVAKAMPDLVSLIPRGEGNLIDHLKRALTSSIFNLSEGNGRSSIKERNRYFDISLGSIEEAKAAIDVALAYRYLPHTYQNLIDTLSWAYNMIRRLKK